MEEFSKELKETSKQQLGRKKSRLGLPRTRKKLDATLQGMYCQVFYQLEIFKTLQEGFEFSAHSVFVQWPYQQGTVPGFLETHKFSLK